MTRLNTHFSVKGINISARYTMFQSLSKQQKLERMRMIAHERDEFSVVS